MDNLEVFSDSGEENPLFIYFFPCSPACRLRLLSFDDFLDFLLLFLTGPSSQSSLSSSPCSLQALLPFEKASCAPTPDQRSASGQMEVAESEVENQAPDPQTAPSPAPPPASAHFKPEEQAATVSEVHQIPKSVKPSEDHAEPNHQKCDDGKEQENKDDAECMALLTLLSTTAEAKQQQEQRQKQKQKQRSSPSSSQSRIHSSSFYSRGGRKSIKRKHAVEDDDEEEDDKEEEENEKQELEAEGANRSRRKKSRLTCQEEEQSRRLKDDDDDEWLPSLPTGELQSPEGTQNEDECDEQDMDAHSASSSFSSFSSASSSP